MGTTFQGRGAVRGGSERLPLIDSLAERLSAIGGSDEEVAAFREAWTDTPPEPDEIEWARHATDAELAHELRKTRAEFADATTVDGDEPEPGGAPEPGTSPSLPADVIRVDDIIEWVGGDPDRARAALDAENERSTQRSTLVEALETLIRAAAI